MATIPYKGEAIPSLEISAHMFVITKTDGQKAKSRILRAAGWMHLGAPEQKDILPDFTTAERELVAVCCAVSEPLQRGYGI